MRPRSVLVLVVALLALLGAPAASAQSDPGPNLTGEILFGGVTGPGNDVSAQCDPTGISRITYRTQGIATGPYPGVFTETGTITIGPQELPPLASRGFHVGRIQDFQATFRIESGATTITGTKTLGSGGIFDIFRPLSRGACAEFSERDVPLPSGGTLPNASGSYRFANVTHARYDATIHSPLGTFRDSGISQLTLENMRAQNEQFTVNEGTFAERFTSIPGLVPPQPATVVLSPATAVNPVGTSHTVTASVSTATGDPVSGTTVLFTVEGAVTAEGECRTNQEGECTFTFAGPTFPGLATITGCADSNGNGQADPAEPCGEATKEYILPVSTPGKTTGGGQILHVDGAGVTFALTFQSDADGVKGECNVVDHPSGQAKVNCLDVLAYVQTANEATVYGNATVDGEPAGLFRIHVVDGGESGIGRDEFDIETQDGYARAGPLTQGDIQVHPPT
jgi:Bacterial Ig-like domain (group 1)